MWLFSARIRTLVVAIASMPSVTAFMEYSRSVTGSCKMKAKKFLSIAKQSQQKQVERSTQTPRRVGKMECRVETQKNKGQDY